MESYNLNAVDYLLKPITFERFLTAVEKAAKAGALFHATAEQPETTVYLKSGPQTYPVKLSDILYLEKDGNYMTVHLKDKRIMIRENMTSVFDLIPAFGFIRVHKSYIVALRHITTIGADQMTVNGERIPVGSSFRETVRAALKLK